MTPKRIQRKRTKGWRMPEGAVYVGRPSKWGNPWRVFPQARTAWDRETPYGVWAVTDGVHVTLGSFVNRERARYWAVQGFRRDLGELVDDVDELRGHDLACWCALCPEHRDGLPLGVTCAACAPCHADVLLELSNR
jgi:hypothetical protein